MATRVVHLLPVSVFSDGTRLERLKSTRVGLPNLDEISQSTAEIKLLPVSENGPPQYWNSISGFYFDVYVVMGLITVCCAACDRCPLFPHSPRQQTDPLFCGTFIQVTIQQILTESTS